MRQQLQLEPETRYRFSIEVYSADAITRVREAIPSWPPNPVAAFTTGSEWAQANPLAIGWQRIYFFRTTPADGRVTLTLEHGFGVDNNAVRGTTRFRNLRIQKIERETTSTRWRMLGLIHRHTDLEVIVDGTPRRVQVTLNDQAIINAKRAYEHIPIVLNDFSGGRIRVTMDVRIVETPLSRITNRTTWFTLDPNDVLPTAHHYINARDYDHVFSTVGLHGDRTNNPNNFVPTPEWSGLGGMSFPHRAWQGFSVVQAWSSPPRPTDTAFDHCWIYIHELSHWLEREAGRLGYTRNQDWPYIHSWRDFGFTNYEEFYRAAFTNRVPRPDGNGYMGFDMTFSRQRMEYEQHLHWGYWVIMPMLGLGTGAFIALVIYWWRPKFNLRRKSK